MKKEPGTDGFLLQVTNCVKEVSISMLSDDDFSKVIYFRNIVYFSNFNLPFDDKSGICVL